MDATIEFTNDTFTLGIPFTKVNAEERTVEGFATADNIDKSGDILDKTATQSAFQRYPGNIREMHQKKAVGKALTILEKDFEHEGDVYTGMWVKARVSKGAQDTWEKVLDGTLKGFSLGGGIQEYQPELRKVNGYDQQVRRITKYNLGEISLVDNPCNGIAEFKLIKSVNGQLEADDSLDDIDEAFEKAAPGVNATRPPMRGTQPMAGKEQPAVAPGMPDPNMQPEDSDRELIQVVLDALAKWRQTEVDEGDDHDLAFVSGIIQQIKERIFAGDPGNTGNDAAVLGDPNQPDAPAKPGQQPGKPPVKSGLTKPPAKPGVVQNKKLQKGVLLQDNENSDISSVELTDEHKSVLRKFLDFITTKDATDEVVDEGENTEMDEKLLKDAVSAAVKEALTTDSNDKFQQIGESLKSVASTLEKVATTEVVEALDTKLEDSLKEIDKRITSLESTGALQKSNDDDGKGEKLEKRAGLWSGNIVPEFVQNRIKEGV